MGEGPSEDGERRVRQWGIIPEEALKKKVLVIGVGGIGSWLTLLLAKMGIKDITVVDDDTVEDHNVASQLFDQDQVGMNKVDAIRDFIQVNTGTKINTFFQKFNKDIKIDENTYVMIGVDSLDARKQIADMLKYEILGGIIDGRMGGEQVEVYTYKAAMQYHTEIKDAPEAQQDACTARSIVYNTNLCGSIMCAQLKKLLCDQKIKKNIVFDLSSMSIITSKEQ